MQKTAIRVLELTSIAKGIESMDVMLKASKINIVVSKTICPGKYIIVINGDAGAVNEAIEKGAASAEKCVLDKLVLPAVHENLLSALNGRRRDVAYYKPIGIVELSSITSGILACDAALKSANVELLEFKIGMLIGGKSYFIISGDTSSLQEAFRTVNKKVDKRRVINSVIISSPDNDLIKHLFG